MVNQLGVDSGSTAAFRWMNATAAARPARHSWHAHKTVARPRRIPMSQFAGPMLDNVRGGYQVRAWVIVGLIVRVVALLSFGVRVVFFVIAKRLVEIV